MMVHAINRFPARQGWEWVKRGVASFRQQPRLWLAMAFVYLAIALVLARIPFIGWLILMLLTPLCMLGALPVAQALAGPGLPAETMPAPPAQRDFRSVALYLREYFTRAARRLFQGASDETTLLPAMVIGTLLLGGLVAVTILAQLLKVGGSGLTAMLSGSVGPSVWLSVLLGLLVVMSLQALLVMAFLYTAPLIAFRREHPLPSIQLSFAAASANLGAFAVFVTVFALAGELLRALFLWLVFPFDFLIVIATGMIVLPVFVGALYASYQDLFSPPAAVPG
jgi:hypothetical protein